MDLVNAARKGQEASFLHLFEEHHLPLFRFAYRLTGSVAKGEDIVQECFLSLLRRECTYDPKRTPLRTYLFGIVRNQSLKRLRTSNFGVDAVAARSPESEILRNETEDAVTRAVTELPETQREVLVLAHYEQMPLGEIAQILGLELGAATSRLQRPRSNLKETLAAYAPGMERKR